MLEFGKEYHQSRVSDYSSIVNNAPNTKIENYYKAEGFMENYDLPITLLGTRRLGKTTVLNQLWEKFHNINSKYIHVGG